MKARIQGGNLSRSVKEDIKKQFIKALDTYNRDAALQVLHICYLSCDKNWGLRGVVDPTDYCSYGERKVENG